MSEEKKNIGNGKILLFSDLKKLREDNRGKTVCFTNGCFDVLHIGHVRCLQEARKHGDLLVVGLNSDFSVKKLKGNDRPINGQDERAEMLAAFPFVDHVVVFDEDTPCRIIEELRPDIWVKGGDYSAGNLPGRDLADKLHIELAFVPLVDGKSTTRILERETPKDERKRVLVIGDTALDFSYFVRQSDEPSAETGLPVVYVKKTQYDAGGAGNLAIDLAVFGDLQVNLCGFCGDDLWSGILREKLEKSGVDCSALVSCRDQSTYVYHRVFNDSYEEQPRFDVRPTRRYNEEEEDILLKSIEKWLPKSDMVILNQQLSISIHSKRFVQKLSAMLKDCRIPVWGDFREQPQYFGCSYKVNLSECRRVTGQRDEKACTEAFYDRYVGRADARGNTVVVTLGENGAMAYNGREFFRVDGIKTSFEKDTVGAGDAFLASLCRCLLSGKDFGEALRYANAAGTASTRYLYACGHPKDDEIRALL